MNRLLWLAFTGVCFLSKLLIKSETNLNLRYYVKNPLFVNRKNVWLEFFSNFFL